ncbi:MAG TPA: winged helix DNA-binding protein [Casimicrobiaceae bacterium]|nr:winged helix DNA-binding protein [Casimicrobiaceae bacterium]
MNASPELLESLCWELRRSFRDLTQSAELELGPLGITASDHAILDLLARETAPVSLSDLARKSSVSRQHIHQSIRRLPNPSWVESVASPDDHRIVLLRLTREGRAFWKKVRAVDQRFFSRFARRFRSEDVRGAVTVLQKLRSELHPALEEHAERS